jgi:hypothetical protein
MLAYITLSFRYQIAMGFNNSTQLEARWNQNPTQPVKTHSIKTKRFTCVNRQIFPAEKPTNYTVCNPTRITVTYVARKHGVPLLQILCNLLGDFRFYLLLQSLCRTWLKHLDVTLSLELNIQKVPSSNYGAMKGYLVSFRGLKWLGSITNLS